MFWIWIVISVVVVIGASVVVGRMLSQPPRTPRSREDRVMALKASGALRHRKSNRE